MSKKLHVELALVFAACARVFAATDNGEVSGEIVGTITRNQVPVPGLAVLSCRDGSVGSSGPCKEPIRAITDQRGRFSFNKIAGVEPPTPESCRANLKCDVADPGWSYWFKIVDGKETKVFWNGGLGYGRLYARIDCDLGSPKTSGNVELDCKVWEIPLRRSQN